MSISSDISKVSITAIQAEHSNKSTEQSFITEKQKQAQVVQKAADSNATDIKKDSGQNLEDRPRSEIAPAEVEDVNVKMRQLSLGVSFELTDESENIVKVVDQETGEVVRQIPSEEFLEMSQRLDDIFGELSSLKGNLINSKV